MPENYYRIHVKNMVCPRCIQTVERILKELGIPFQSVSLGTAIILRELTRQEESLLREKLYEQGFELLTDGKEKLVEQIKTLIIGYVHYGGEDIKSFSSLSAFLREKLHKDYSLLSRIFSEKEGITIEKYAIMQRIEKVKELLTYNELTISEIAYKLGYSSPAHLSKQFKQITGVSPKEFKQSLSINRKFLDEL